MPGIRTSRIRQAVSRTWSELKNDSAEENPCTRNPTERIRLSRLLLKKSSSSTNEMSGKRGIQPVSPLVVTFRKKPYSLRCAKAESLSHLWFDCDRLLDNNMTRARGGFYNPLGQRATTLGWGF